MTEYYRDGVINGIELGGCYMSWMLQGTNAPSWFLQKASVCYRFTSGLNMMFSPYFQGKNEDCGLIGNATTEFFDLTDDRDKGCIISWIFQTAPVINRYAWLASTKLCIQLTIKCDFFSFD